MSRLIVSIAPTSLDDLRERCARAWNGGADAVEIRIDSHPIISSALNAFISEHDDRMWIVTCRGAEEGGESTAESVDRARLLALTARGTGAWVDFEFGDWVGFPAVPGILRPPSATASGTMLRLILSAHDFSDRPDRPNVSALCRAIDDLPPHSVAKIAYHADHMVDTFDALDLMHRYGERMMAVAMGEEGLWTRVLVGKLGGFGTYCALDADAATAPGQPLLRQMIDLIRWPSIDKDTKVYGVVGDPVAHSVGPLLHNRWFAEAGLNAVYLPLRVRRCVDPQGGTNGRDNGNGRGSGGPRRSDLGRFLEACRKRPWLDVSGLSVTTPHKQAALEWVGYGANAMARSIGAVNTLCFSGEGAQGYNTDADAALDSLIDALGCSRGDLSGLSVDVLGSGGAARALVHGLAEFGCRITIYGRSAPSIERLAGDYGATGRGWNERTRRDGRVLVNCTSVGMWPDAGASPLPPGSSFSDCDLVFDLIYNPLETRLLRDAKAAGVKTLNGLDTFIRQAAAQFELWTGRPPDTAGSYEAVTQALSRTTETGHGPD